MKLKPYPKYKDSEIQWIGEIPKGWNKKPPNSDEIPEKVFILQVDAGYKKGVTGISTIIKTKDKEYKPSEYSGRNRGPVHAELTSVKKGLQRMKNIRKPVEMVIVYNDNLYVNYFLNGIWTARRRYIKETLRDINKLVHELKVDVRFICISAKYNKRVDRRAGKKRKKEEIKKDEQIQKRVVKVDEAIARGNSISIEERDGKYYAVSSNDQNKKYEVSLDPPSCECAWWQKNWVNKEIYIQKARALPCKHICALAKYLGKDVFEIFNKQINRVD